MDPRDYIEGVGADEDRLLNAATGGNPSQTVSTRVARARDAGKRWGCIGCRLLNLIEPDHCTKVLRPDYTISTPTLIRLALALATLTGLVVVLSDHLLEALARTLWALSTSIL